MLEGPIKIGNIDLYPYLINHSKEDWEVNGQSLIEAMRRFGLIMPEYFPPEYSGIRDRIPILGRYITDNLDPSDNYLFKKVEEFCKENKKNVYVLDPAYNESFIIFHGILFLPVTGMLSAVAAKMGYELFKQNSNTITRRAFLKGIVAVCSATAATQLSIGALQGPHKIPGPSVVLGNIEDQFRESQVAQNLIKLGDLLPAQTEALLIYPPSHWKGIEYYLENADSRRETLGKYRWLRWFGLKSLYEIRHYPEGVS